MLFDGSRIIVSDLSSGTGSSSKPDGIQEVQLGVEVEVAHGVVEYFKNGNAGISFGRIIGVGHSVGRCARLHIVLHA